MDIKAKLAIALSSAMLATAAFVPVALADGLDNENSSGVAQPEAETAAPITPVSPKKLIGNTFTSGGSTYKITSISYKTWSTGKATVSLVKYKSSSKSAKIPNAVKKTFSFSANEGSPEEKHNVSFAVTEIAASAFDNAKGHKITKVTIGANVTKIGNKAFKGCKKLKTIVVKGEKIIQVGSNKGSVKAKTLTKLKKKWKSGNAFKGLPRSCRVTVPKPKGLNFGYAENVRQLFGHAGFKGVVSW